MCIRLAALAGVTAVAITATIKQINADQHLPLANAATADSAQAAGSTPNRPCGCSHGLQSSTPDPAPTPRSGAFDVLELEVNKLQQATVDAEAQREQAEKERKLLENELNNMKAQLVAAQRFHAQRDVQIAELKRAANRGTNYRDDQNQNARIAARAQSNQPSVNGPRGASSQGRAKPAKSVVHIFAKPPVADCMRAVRPLYHYGPYEVITPWGEILR
jgi:hypothetical protein